MSLGESGQGLGSGIRPGTLEIKDEAQGKYPFEEWEFSKPEATTPTVKVNRALIAPAVTTSTLTTGSVTTGTIATGTLTLSTLALASLTVSTLVGGAVSATTLSTPAISSPNADIFACRAHAHVLSGTAADLTGTYARVGTQVTVTVVGHGFTAGHRVYLNFTSGTAVDGLFPVDSAPTANTFIVTHGTSGNTSGNVTIPRVSIVSGGNISSIVKEGTGHYYGNLTSGASGDDLLTVVGSATRENDLYTMSFIPGPGIYAKSFEFFTRNVGNNNADGKRITLAVFW